MREGAFIREYMIHHESSMMDDRLEFSNMCHSFGAVKPHIPCIVFFWHGLKLETLRFCTWQCDSLYVSSKTTAI